MKIEVFMKKLSLLIILLLFVATGCFGNVKEMKNNQKLAKTEGIRYIKDKYNITITEDDILDVDLDTQIVNEYDAEYTGVAHLYVRYNYESFDVVVNYLEKNRDTYYDNYEKSKIIDGIKKMYCNLLGIEEVNTKIFIPDYFALGEQTHDKYSDADTLVRKIKKAEANDVYIITSNSLDQNKVKEASHKFTNVTLSVNRVYDRENIVYYDDTYYGSYSYNSLKQYMFNETQNLYIEEAYDCDELTCTFDKYKKQELIENIFVKTSINDNLEIVKESNPTVIEKYRNKVNTCNKNLQLVDVYKVVNKGNNSKPMVGIYSFNNINGKNYTSYGLDMDHSAICLYDATQNALVLDGTEYIGVINK